MEGNLRSIGPLIDDSLSGISSRNLQRIPISQERVRILLFNAPGFMVCELHKQIPKNRAGRESGTNVNDNLIEQGIRFHVFLWLSASTCYTLYYLIILQLICSQKGRQRRENFNNCCSLMCAPYRKSGSHNIFIIVKLREQSFPVVV